MPVFVQFVSLHVFFPRNVLNAESAETLILCLTRAKYLCRSVSHASKVPLTCDATSSESVFTSTSSMLISWASFNPASNASYSAWVFVTGKLSLTACSILVSQGLTRMIPSSSEFNPEASSTNIFQHSET
ncbi:hypothetical protein KSP39_PZI008027 [Platanthera zijinensis]|uniref:Uncharacterized protein n=1 Tax=Platanthera zijinensis TaxID=2320716 RepID=A0AAP0G9A3_9ASPA